jgi:hypothetical protein
MEHDENLDELVKQFSQLGVQIAWRMCNKFLDNIQKHYPNTPREDFLNLALLTFKENELPIDSKLSMISKSKISDQERCAKVLQSGKNKGSKCSLPKTEGSEYCKRHRNQILGSSTKKDPLKERQIKDYMSILQPKASDAKKPTALDIRQYKDENMYFETNTNLVFRKDNDEYVAFGIYVDSEGGVASLTKNEINLCEKNGWKYSKSK